MVSTKVRLERGKLYPVEVLEACEITLVENPVPCGFPSPAQDYLQTPIDLNNVLIDNATATFVFIAEGDSMKGANIPDGSLVLIDRSIPPKHDDIVLASVNGEFTLKRLNKKLMALMPENPAFQPMVIKEGVEVMICGVVTNVIIQLNKRHVRPRRLQ